MLKKLTVIALYSLAILPTMHASEESPQLKELPDSLHPYGLIATDERLNPLGDHLKMPPASESGLVQTLNYGGGFMLTHLDPISAKFINFAKTTTHPILEIGSAFGVATIAALKHSSSIVIANDIGVENLLILRNNTDEKYRKRLYLNANRFPQQLDLDANSLEGILICRVFHFLRSEEIEEGLAKLYQWLIPGGKLFIVTATPFQGNLKEFIPVYEERWANNNPWPGYVENYGLTVPGLSHNLTPFLHVMDERPLKKALEFAGFEIQEIEYIDRRKTIPTVGLDGKEGIGLIATKPVNKN